MLAFPALAAAVVGSAATLARASPLAPRELNSTSTSDRNLTSTHPQVIVSGSTCTVKPLGGAQDDSSALLYAFDLCGSDATVNLPGYYVVDGVLNTTLHNVDVNLSGAIQYTPNIAYWSPNSIYLTYQNATTYWLFQGTNVTLQGGGTIDGNGQVWWDAVANGGSLGVAGGSSRDFSRPIPLTVGNANGVVVRDLQIVNSPFWSNFVYQSTNVTYDNIRVSAVSYNSSVPTKNSDGWDIYRSSDVTITNVHVDNDDDCVSLKPNATSIHLANLWCNGSHGISIGSLGQYAGETDIVRDVYVRNVSMLHAQNGARIKVFGGSDDPASVSGGGSGYVRNVTFEDFFVDDVDYPILIDQCYDTDAAACAANPATLTISDVHYRNFSGTSSGALANDTVVDLECSAECTNITATDIRIAPANGTVADATYVCVNIADVSLLDFPCSTTPLSS